MKNFTFLLKLRYLTSLLFNVGDATITDRRSFMERFYEIFLNTCSTYRLPNSNIRPAELQFVNFAEESKNCLQWENRRF